MTVRRKDSSEDVPDPLNYRYQHDQVEKDAISISYLSNPQIMPSNVMSICNVVLEVCDVRGKVIPMDRDKVDVAPGTE